MIALRKAVSSLMVGESYPTGERGAKVRGSESAGEKQPVAFELLGKLPGNLLRNPVVVEPALAQTRHHGVVGHRVGPGLDRVVVHAQFDQVLQVWGGEECLRARVADPA